MTLPSKQDPSDPQNWLALLPSMEGKLFLFMGTQERVLHHEAGDESVKIKTDRKTRNIDLYDLQKFLIGVVPCGKEESSNHALTVVDQNASENSSPSTADLMVLIQNSGMSDLQKKLMETIKKVDENPEYVQQAHAINNLAKTAVNMVNTQLQFLKKK